MSLSLPQATLAIGALGTAATGLVDSTKAFWGGMSRAGFGFIQSVVVRLVPQTPHTDFGTGLSREDILDTLRANWMNGMDTASQKSIAKSFIKLHFNSATAERLAKETNVNIALLQQVAAKMPISSQSTTGPSEPQPLTAIESDTFGRFDLALSALVDKAYERGDQWYRNWCKVLAAAFAVGLAFAGNYSLGLHHDPYIPAWQALIIGLVATPLAPVAKDIANAIQTASDTMQTLKG